MRSLTIGDRTISYEVKGEDQVTGDPSLSHYNELKTTHADLPRTTSPCGLDSGTGSVCSEDQEEMGASQVGRSDVSLQSDMSLENDMSLSLSPKKMIKPDVTAISQLLNFDEEEEEDTSDSEEVGDDKEGDEDLSDSEEGGDDRQQKIDWPKTVVKDLTTPDRRHSVTTPQSEGLVTTPQSPEGDGQDRTGQQGKQTLCLNLAEVKHIRSALTKAELEGLPPAVSSGKICFSCIKTKFGLFSRGQSCDICTQLVCGQCASKMRIPSEQFSQTPVLVLSPAHHPPTATPLTQLGVSDLQQNTAGSTPTSPCSQRRDREEEEEEGEDAEENEDNPPSSLPPPELLRIHTLSGRLENTEEGETPTEEAGPISLPVGRDEYSTLPRKTCRRWSMVSNRSSTEQREQLEGSLLSVCTDCKQMVLQVIRTSRSQRKSHPSRQSSVFFSHLSQPGNGGGTEQRY